MEYLIKDTILTIKYVPGKGSWTYHLVIPNTRELKGKWGNIKVSGTIDGLKIDNRNLAPTKGGDKLLSINSAVRKEINKQGGDTVMVSLYLIKDREAIDESKIIESLKDSETYIQFKKLTNDQQSQTIQEILSQTTEEQKIKVLIKHIDRLSS